jgi:hypothetical protein
MLIATYWCHLALLADGVTSCASIMNWKGGGIKCVRPCEVLLRCLPAGTQKIT